MPRSQNFSLKRSNSGVTYVEAGNVTFAVVTPSRKREVLILGSPVLEFANVFVHESELPAYERSFKLAQVEPANVNV